MRKVLSYRDIICVWRRQIDVLSTNHRKTDCEKSGLSVFTPPDAQKTKGSFFEKSWNECYHPFFKDAWISIRRDMIVKSVTQCGISSAMDGTEERYLRKR